MYYRIALALTAWVGICALTFADAPPAKKADVSSADALKKTGKEAKAAPETIGYPGDHDNQPDHSVWGDGCCNGDCPGSGSPFWVEADYLIWWMRGYALPPLVTTSPNNGNLVRPAAIGSPGTTILFGDTLADGSARSGFRIDAGYWLDDENTIGIEASYLRLESKVRRFGASSTGDPILGRPFFNTELNQNDAELVAFPGVLAGAVSVTAVSTGLEGAELLARQNLCCKCDYRLDFVIGYRFLRLNENLGIAENLIATGANNPNGVPQGTTINLTDLFGTKNEFNGGEIGLIGEYRRGAWQLGWKAKLALGQNRQNVDIAGATTSTAPGTAPVVSTGGLYALSTNIGHFAHDRFSVIPEIGLKVGYHLSDSMSVHVGYTFLYWDDVLRPGNQIDTLINPNFIPPAVNGATGAFRPITKFESTNFWAQGIDLGVEFHF